MQSNLSAFRVRVDYTLGDDPEELRFHCRVLLVPSEGLAWAEDEGLRLFRLIHEEGEADVIQATAEEEVPQ